MVHVSEIVPFIRMQGTLSMWKRMYDDKRESTDTLSSLTSRRQSGNVIDIDCYPEENI